MSNYYGMNSMQVAVDEFHEATEQPPGLNTPEKRELRAKLIMEEAVETVAALGFDVDANICDLNTRWSRNEPNASVVARFHKSYDDLNLLGFIDGLCDLSYVVMGGAVNAGVNLQRHFDEVHRCNMAKLSGPKRADGKQLKPEGWVGPDHQRILDTYFRTTEA